MQLLRSPEQRELGATVRALLADHAGSAQVRAALDSDLGHDPDLWRRLAALDVLGLVAPGSGGGHAERAVVAEELGRAVVPVPFLSSAVLAVDTLLALGDDAGLLPVLTGGERIAALAVAEPGTRALDPGATLTRGTRRGEGWVVDGCKTPVIDAQAADVLLVYAATADGPAVFVVDAAAPGLTRTPLRTLDPTRRMARIDLAAAPATRLAGDAGAAVAAVADHAALALGAEQVGIMSRALELTVDHARVRHQFGRPIGSFQAVKHGLADVYTDLEQARSALAHACWAADAAPAELPLAAALLTVHAGPACFRATRAMIQYHGGIGYTWEHDAHLFYKRAKADELLLDSPAGHRARLADLLGI